MEFKQSCRKYSKCSCFLHLNSFSLHDAIKPDFHQHLNLPRTRRLTPPDTYNHLL